MACVYPPSQAAIQGIPFRATTQGMLRVYPPSRVRTQGMPLRATTLGMLQLVHL